MLKNWKDRARALAAASAGTLVFVQLGLPLPVLLGPMFGCLLAALAGASMRDLGGFSTFMRTFLGVAIGSSVTPDLVRHLPELGYTLMLVPLFVLAIGGLGYPLFRKLGFNHPTAFYSAMPGGLQDMLVFGQEAGGDVRALSLIHATRVLVIVAVAPFFITRLFDIDLTAAPGVPAATLPLSELVLFVMLGLVGWKLAARIGMFGASILGPLILTAIFSLSGIIAHRPPAEIIWAAQFFVGIAVGVKYAGITGRELRHDVLAGLAYSALLAMISLGFFMIARAVSPAGTLDILLSFLPGGQAEMAVIAIVAGADVAYVVTHHLLRIFVVILLAPVVARFFDRDAPR